MLMLVLTLVIVLMLVYNSGLLFGPKRGTPGRRTRKEDCSLYVIRHPVNGFLDLTSVHNSP